MAQARKQNQQSGLLEYAQDLTDTASRAIFGEAKQVGRGKAVAYAVAATVVALVAAVALFRACRQAPVTAGVVVIISTILAWNALQTILEPLAVVQMVLVLMVMGYGENVVDDIGKRAVWPSLLAFPLELGAALGSSVALGYGLAAGLGAAPIVRGVAGLAMLGAWFALNAKQDGIIQKPTFAIKQWEWDQEGQREDGRKLVRLLWKLKNSKPPAPTPTPTPTPTPSSKPTVAP